MENDSRIEPLSCQLFWQGEEHNNSNEESGAAAVDHLARWPKAGTHSHFHSQAAFRVVHGS